jgi:hypothetical protein
MTRLVFAAVVAAQVSAGLVGDRAFKDLIRFVNDATAGRPAPRDFTPDVQLHFLRAANGNTFVPMVISLPSGERPAPSADVYVRGFAPGGISDKVALEPVYGREEYRPSMRVFPIENAAVVPLDLAVGTHHSRGEFAFAAAPGAYVVHGAIRERTKSHARAAVFSKSITVPDFRGPNMALSSVVLAEQIEQVPPSTKPSPYTLGTLRVVPALGQIFSGDRPLNAVIVVYNVSADASGKPNASAEFSFNKVTAAGESFFTRTRPQLLSPATLPPTFDLRRGDQLIAGQEVALNMFDAGDYRLLITVTDHASGRTAVATERFSVSR